MIEKSCPHCQRPYPPQMIFKGVRKQRLYECVAKHPEGISVERIKDYVYADDPDGGPESRSLIGVMVNKLNKALAAHGVRIKGSGGEGSVYRVISL